MSRITIAAVLLLGLAGQVHATPQCPKEVDTQQYLTVTIPGWRDMRSATPHRLNRVSVYYGRPADRVALVPDATRHEKGRDVSTWLFGGALEKSIWIECGYAGTSITLARELPADTKGCIVFADPKARISGQPRIERLECK